MGYAGVRFGDFAVGAFSAFMASVTWAFASVRYAEASRVAGPVRVNLLRALTATALWSVALLVVHGTSAFAEVTPEHALWLAASIACSYGIGDGIFFVAAERIGVSSALAIATIYPLWAALYGALARGEALGAGRSVGMLCCLVGISAILRLSRGAETGARHTGAAFGVALAVITSWFWAANAVFLKLGAEGISVYRANALRFAFGAVFLLAQVVGRRAPKEVATPAATSKQGEARLVSLGHRLAIALLADTGLGAICYIYGIANTDLALGATLSSLSPLVAMPIGLALGTERLTVARAVAVCVTVSGVVLLVVAPA